MSDNSISYLPLPDKFWPVLKLYLKPFWGRLAVIQLCAFAWSVDGLAFPYIIGKMVDVMTAAGSREELFPQAWPYMLAYMVLWPITEAGYRLAGFKAAKTNPYIRARIQADIYKRLHYQDYRFLINQQSGDLLTKLRDVSDGVMHVLDQVIWQVNNVLLTVIVTSISLFTVHPAFGLGTFAIGLVFLGIAAKTNPIVARSSEQVAQARSKLSGHIIDGLANFLAVRVFGSLRHETTTYGILQESERSSIAANVRTMEFVRLGYGVSAYVLLGAVVYCGTFYGWYKGWVTAGEIVIINGLASVVLQRLWFLCNDLPQIVTHIGAAQQALKLLATSPTVTDKPDAPAFQPQHGEIELRDVSFGYRDPMLFKNLSLTIPAGQKVGLVGFSGSGKSSFVRLLLRLYDVHGGSISIDGQGIKDVTQESLRRAISFIPQEPELFHRTVAENIAIGKPDASMEEIVAAAKVAHAHDYIVNLQEGYESVVGERGIKLSGGQRQRIAIARVALQQNNILVMDEATSALDSVTEQDVQQSLETLMQGRTTIVIAHRLSTLRAMDRILVLDNGEIVQDGKVEALKAQPGIFQTLWNAQIGGFLPDKHTHGV